MAISHPRLAAGIVGSRPGDVPHTSLLGCTKGVSQADEMTSSDISHRRLLASALALYLEIVVWYSASTINLDVFLQDF
jgi:hypothetical protein